MADEAPVAELRPGEHKWKSPYLGLSQCESCKKIVYTFMVDKEKDDCKGPSIWERERE